MFLRYFLGFGQRPALAKVGLEVKILMKLSYCVLGVVIGFSWAGFEFCHK